MIFFYKMIQITSLKRKKWKTYVKSCSWNLANSLLFVKVGNHSLNMYLFQTENLHQGDVYHATVGEEMEEVCIIMQLKCV
jgi:hypothetical protein